MDLRSDNELYESVSVLIRQLASRPELVQINVERSESSLHFVVYAHPADMKRLIGKAGLMSRSVRTILSAIGLTRGKAITLELCELPDFPSLLPSTKKRRNSDAT